jgi:hypothetical protein
VLEAEEGMSAEKTIVALPSEATLQRAAAAVAAIGIGAATGSVSRL